MHLLKGRQLKSIEEELKNVDESKIKALFSDNFALWCRFSGVKVDEKPFTFDNRRYILPIYLDDSPEMAIIKSAQTGLTIFMLLKIIWFAYHNQVNIGLYLPNADLVKSMVKTRVNPLIDSIPDIAAAIEADADTLSVKRIRNLKGGTSTIHFLFLGGVSSKDSFPLDVIFFDELRLVEEADVDQAEQRVNASPYRYKYYASTSGSAATTIHKKFLQGSQNIFLSKCGCKDWCNLAETFPDCVVEFKGEVYYRCPKCKFRIHNPQLGGYVEHNPGAPFPSYQFSSLVANVLTPKEIWRKFNETTNRPDFYNSILGKPYQDLEATPIDDAILATCVNDQIQWAIKSDSPSRALSGEGTVMGVDQMAGYAYAIIGKRNSEGKVQIVHYEIIETGNPIYGEVTPFKRLHQLMNEFNVQVAIVDAQPSFNEAAEMARAFPGRVFISYYTYGGTDMVRWQDRPKEKSTTRKGDKTIKLPFVVVIQRYQAIDFVTQEVQNAHIIWPNPDQLVPIVRSEKTGRFEPENIFKTKFYHHLKSVERVRKYDPDKGSEKLVWKEHVDPHSLHALVLMMVALGRARKQARLYWPE